MRVINKEIEMIASIDKNGVIMPIRFRLLTELGEYAIIKVDKVLKRDTPKLGGERYHALICQSVISGTLKEYELRYQLDKMCWVLYKI